MKKIRVSIILIAMLVLSTLTLCYGDTKSDVKVVYNAHTLDFGDKGVVNQDGSIYIPIRAFSEKLHYTVDWNATTNTARIYDNLNDIYLSTNGDLKVNGVEGKSDKVPIKVDGSIYVPLRFVSETLGVNVNYDSSKKVVDMTGRTIYEIYQKDVYKPQLIGFTSDGEKITISLGDRTGQFTKEDMSESNLTRVLRVDRTEYSDVVTTNYTYQGGLSVYACSQYYIKKDGTLVDKTDVASNAYDYNTEKSIGVKYFDGRVALLVEDKNNNNIIRIYDDKTATLIKEINPRETFNSSFDDLKQNEYNGQVENIQAVGEDFIVVNMYQPSSSSIYRDGFSYPYTTVINLDTMELTPVYEKVNAFEAGEIYLPEGAFGGCNDYVYFVDRMSDGKLKFVTKYGNFNKGRETEVTIVDYK